MSSSLQKGILLGVIVCLPVLIVLLGNGDDGRSFDIVHGQGRIHSIKNISGEELTKIRVSVAWDSNERHTYGAGKFKPGELFYPGDWYGNGVIVEILIFSTNMEDVVRKENYPCAGRK